MTVVTHLHELTGELPDYLYQEIDRRWSRGEVGGVEAIYHQWDDPVAICQLIGDGVKLCNCIHLPLFEVLCYAL